jgi:hypothetical protein
MKAKPPVKLIKSADRNKSKNRDKVKSAARPKTRSTAFKSWVVEFQERDRTESLPAFDSLFKDPLPEPAPAD